MNYRTNGMKIKIFGVILLLLFTDSALSQSNSGISEREIKLSGNYYWGEGIRDSLDDAKKDAIMDLQYKICVTLKASSESSTIENDEGISSSFSKNIQMFSTIKLKRLEFFTKQRSDGKYLVDAYLSKENYKRMIEEISNDVIDRVKLAESTEKERGIAYAIPLYYKAYLYTYFSPDPIGYKSITYRQEYNNVRFFLETKIRSYLAELEIEQDSIYVDPSTADLITVFLNVNYLKLDVDNVEISFNLPGNPKQRIEHGKAKVFLYSQPSAIKEEYELILNVYFKGDKDLEDFNEQFPILEKQKLELDFTKIVKFDFKVTPLSDGSLKFEPIVKNLSVSSILWDFGNEVTSTDTKSIYNFTDEKPHKISLTVNGIDKMKVIKVVNNKGEIIEEEKADYSKDGKLLHPIVNNLLQRKTFDTLIQELINYKKDGKLLFSLKSSDFIDLAKCYGIVIDRVSRKVVGFLSPGKKNRTDLTVNENVEDYRVKFKGKGIIWFQLN